jgi:hypothetical protein
MGLVKAHDHVVVVERTHDDFCVKVGGKWVGDRGKGKDGKGRADVAK